ncbi:MAG TPA: bifunctional alpha,alpha-trehalose-phosphate synthase (UDP-forming)/trehalose-phosphatase [Verrucomicrobiae bacterium]|nr:bifunctional alpha,alpha-trehalose-phosphate synthase (UDP-forming)/trehalose-phosphatase [Verrucomicrobiae bacterium]
MARSKFIIVSNRLPVSVSKEDGKLVFTSSSGGLAKAMASLDSNAKDRIWIGWPGIASDDLTSQDKSAITRKLKSFGCYPIFLTKAQVDNFYAGYANDTIWPLFHYFQSLAQYDAAYWQAYKEVNDVFRRAIVRKAEPDSAIWIHDYHLMLLPQLIRKALPGATIGFFLHIPFPSYEIFRQLPNRKEILQGLLGADLIGFHIYDYARHFLSSVLRVLGLENDSGSIIKGTRIVKVDAFPIGIDYQKWVDSLEDDQTKVELQKLQEHYNGQKIIISMDRLDYSKGILKRLEAFEQFLRSAPSWHKKVVLLMVAVPSRTEVDTYKELRNEIEKAVSRINGDYGTVDWTPISYQFKNLPFEQISALLARADVALLTPLRDGMNLVAKEYIATKQKASGVLILSEMTGAVDELPEALRINPNDTASVVQALKIALKMSQKEKRARLLAMQRRLSRYTVQRWAADFMDQLQKSKLAQTQESNKLLTREREDKIVRQFQKAKNRLLFLDYDGTLRKFAASHHPAQARPPKQLLQLLHQLAQLPDTRICIVSGRPRDALEMWFSELPVLLAAEHGAFMKYDGEWSQQPSSLHEHRKHIMPILEQYAERTPGARIEEKESAIVWHYRTVPTELAHARNAGLRYELRQLLAGSDILVHNGAKVIEIKPRNVNKGIVVEDLQAMYPSDFVMAIGDDYTDEDMFRALPEEANSIKVGLGGTEARHQIVSIEQVLKLLLRLAQVEMKPKQ